MPKSKKPWKIGSERSSKHNKYYPKTWEEKKSERLKIKALRDRLKDAREKKKQDVIKIFI